MFYSRYLLLILVAGLTLQLPSHALFAQSETIVEGTVRQRFSYADLQRLRNVDDVEMSSTGERIAFTVSAVDPRRDTSIETLWVLHTAEKTAVPVTVSDASAPAWSPDGQQLAIVHQGSDGKSTIQLLKSINLQAVSSFAVSASPERLVWSPDGKSLAFTLFVATKAAPSFLQTAVDSAEADLAKPADAQWAPPVQLTQAARYRRDGGIWLKPGHNHLFVLSTTTGEVHQVGSDPFNDREPAWLPDNKTLLFTSDRRPEGEHANQKLSIFKTDLLGHATQLTHVQGSCSSPTSSPDGSWIAYTETPVRAVNYTRDNLVVMHPDGSETHRLAVRLDRDLYAPRWDGGGQTIYAEYDDHGIFRVGRFGLDGNMKELVAGVGGAFSVSLKGDVAYASTSDTGPDELSLQRAGAAPKTLTSLNAFLSERELGHLLHIEVKSSKDRTPVEGWALLPPGRARQTKLPTIFAMHGGPFGSDGPNWSSKFELFAAAGYAVVYANYRGSTSYGSSFSEPANHNFPGTAFDDMMSIVDEAIARGFADPDRLFITGGSAGGQLTAWITGKSKRFKAAVAEKPVINVMSDSLAADQYLASPEVLGGYPWTREKELWAHSPLSLAGSMKTPTLFIVGEEDYRTPIDQTLQLYGALQLQSIPTALMRVPGAGHENLGSRPSQLAAEVAAALAWFKRYDPLSANQ